MIPLKTTVDVKQDDAEQTVLHNRAWCLWVERKVGIWREKQAFIYCDDGYCAERFNSADTVCPKPVCYRAFQDWSLISAWEMTCEYPWNSLPDKSIFGYLNFGSCLVVYTSNVMQGKLSVFMPGARCINLTLKCGDAPSYVTDPWQKPCTPKLVWASLVGNTSRVLSHVITGSIKLSPYGEHKRKDPTLHIYPFCCL